MGQIHQQKQGLKRLGRIRQTGLQTTLSPEATADRKQRHSLIFPSNFWPTHVSHRIMRDKRGNPTGRINETVFLALSRLHRSNLRLQ